MAGGGKSVAAGGEARSKKGAVEEKGKGCSQNEGSHG